jgi:hypothetical protein
MRKRFIVRDFKTVYIYRERGSGWQGLEKTVYYRDFKNGLHIYIERGSR